MRKIINLGKLKSNKNNDNVRAYLIDFIENNQTVSHEEQNIMTIKTPN